MATIRKDLGVATAYGYARSKGYTGTEEEFAALMASYATVAQSAAQSAEAAAGSAEAAQNARDKAAEWASGTPGGTPGETNNAEYFADRASGSAAGAEESALKGEGFAVGEQNGSAVESGSPYYHNNSKYYSEQASGAAGAAGDQAAAASAGALKSEGFAVGTQSGSAVEPGSPYYRNNAEYYRDKAQEIYESIPESYSDLAGDVSDLKSAFDSLDDEYHAHIVDGINLFNPDDPDLVEDVELNKNGSTAEKTGYFASGYIPVKPGKTLCCHYPTGVYGSASSMVAYDDLKQRTGYLTVERLTDGNGRNYIRKTFASNETAKYVRMTGVMANEPWYMYVYADEMPSTYTPYTTNKTLEGTNVDYSLIKNVSVSKKQTSFIDNTPVNLVDLSALVPGIITNSSSNGNIDTSGTYGTNWVTTDYIPVEPGATYALCIFPGVNYGSGFVGIPYYDADHNFLGRVKQPGGSIGALANRVTITLPDQSNVKYIRASYYKSYTDSTGSDHKRWWQTQIFKASAWPGDLYVPYDDSDRIVDTRLDDAVSGKYNTLWGKSAIWNGDSICAADSDTGAGWPGRVATANGMKYKNYGIAGGTIAENTGSGVHSVCATLDTMLTDFPNADYVIIEGGTNDADILGDNGIGTFDADDFTDAYIEALNKDTFSGALESIFYRLVTQMKTKHIGYLIPQKMGHTAVLVARRRTYFDRAIAICKKWGIPYLDLWDDFWFNWELAAHWDQTKTTSENEAAGNLYIDGQHLTTTGYAVEAPVIAEWMKTI